MGDTSEIANGDDLADPDGTLGSDEDGLWRVRAALDDDLDTPTALAALDDEASLGRPVVLGAALLGITL